MMYEEQTERVNDDGARPLRGPGGVSTAADAGDRQSKAGVARWPKEINSWGRGWWW